jgi:uncharacterized protein YkwD
VGNARWTLVALAALAAAVLAFPAMASVSVASDAQVKASVLLQSNAVWRARAFPAQASAPASVASDAQLNASVLVKINDVRRAHGLAPVRENAKLERAAAAHSRAMATYGFFAHESRDGTPFWKRIARDYTSKGYRYWTVGETLLFSTDALGGAAAVRMWMNSPPHRKVLLSPAWREIGVAALTAHAAPGDFDGRDVTLLTADFGVRR